MNLVQEVASELERNYAWQQSSPEKLESRRRNIHGMPGIPSRIYEQTLLSIAENSPRLTGLLLGIRPPANLEFLGAGTTQTVVKMFGRVAKIHRTSMYMTFEQQVALADRLNEKHRLACNYLGNIVVKQHAVVVKHPFRNNKTATVSYQKYRTFENPEVFEPYKPQLKAGAIDYLHKRYAQHTPQLTQQLHSLASNIICLYAGTGELMDTSGLDNIVIATDTEEPEFIYLDGTPVNQNKPEVTKRILGQLDAVLSLSPT